MPAREPLELTGPLAGNHLAILRDATTDSPAFRRSAEVLTTLVLAAALGELGEREIAVRTPLAETTERVPARRITVVPILRAGLAMLSPALTLLPDDTRVGFLGMARDEATLRPRAYLDSLPAELGGDDVLVLDPMVATGGSALAALGALRAAGARNIGLAGIIAAPEGLARIRGADPDVPITVAAIDERLNKRGFIVPGLGDAGDRLYAESAPG
ncbi:MAG TPA: uracil phosphoribosyltransferase [Miltoncostaeaceae bacterium]|nr:uracil phosphoribosyltransferase [Miltoncostaeaceae bacterium]